MRFLRRSNLSLLACGAVTFASLWFAAPARAYICQPTGDCGQPYPDSYALACQPVALPEGTRPLNYNGSHIADVTIMYEPSPCRLTFSKVSYLINNPVRYYANINRISGPAGDTYQLPADFFWNSGSNYGYSFIASVQLNDAGYQSIAWGDYASNWQLFYYPDVSHYSAYVNTNPF